MNAFKGEISFTSWDSQPRNFRNGRKAREVNDWAKGGLLAGVANGRKAGEVNDWAKGGLLAGAANGRKAGEVSD